MSEKEREAPAPEPVADGGQKEPFLSRWSRLKADNELKARESSPPAVAPEPGPKEGEQAEGEPETLPPGDEDMPPIESLDENSDISGFFSPRVSDALRKQALRKLFRSQKFNVIDPLDHYIEDFRNFPPLGDIVTSDMKHAAERLLKKQQEEEEAAQAEEEAAKARRAAEAEAEAPTEDENDAPAGEAADAAEFNADAAENGAGHPQNDSEDSERDA